MTFEEFVRDAFGHDRWIPTLVVDSSQLIPDLRYQGRTGGKPILLRLLQAKKVKAFIPDLACEEVREKFPKIARASKKTVGEIEALWKDEYLPYLYPVAIDRSWRPRSHLLRDLRDPNDRDFVLMTLLISPDWLVSRDDDLSVLGIASEDPSSDLRLLKVHHDLFDRGIGAAQFTSMGFHLIGEATKTSIQGAKAAWRFYRSLPGILQFGLAAAGGYLAIQRLQQPNQGKRPANDRLAFRTSSVLTRLP